VFAAAQLFAVNVNPPSPPLPVVGTLACFIWLSRNLDIIRNSPHDMIFKLLAQFLVSHQRLFGTTKLEKARLLLETTPGPLCSVLTNSNL
jgi:hypothetical protein